MRVYIKDCNGEIIGNPKGYRTMKGATREAWGRHYAAINAKYDELHKDDKEYNPRGSYTLFSIRSYDE